ncbi:MAG: DNA translocase FtsK [Anaerolineales bacterium]|nr:DNA translocase FtsK [Anaerolineales bacterium]
MGFLGNLFRKPAPPKGKAKGKAPAAKGGPAPRGGKGGPEPRASRPSRSAPPPEQLPLPQPGLSLDRKLDIFGVGLIVVGALSLLSLFSASQSPLLEAWLKMLSGLAGDGRFGLPVALILIGGWIVLRKFGDQLPKVEFERLAGVVLIYLAFLTSLHFAAAPSDQEIYLVAERGAGGGYVGAVILATLFAAVGQLGTAVVLAAWWLMAVVLTLGVSVPEMMLWAANRLRQLRARAAPADEAAPPFNRPPPAREPAEPPAAPTPRASAPSLKPAGAKGASAARSETAPPPAFPPAPPAAGPAFEQPFVIGGEQVWELPSLADLLESGSETTADDEYDRKRVQIIESTLVSFGAPVRVVEINRGPTITQFGVEPDFVETRGGKKTKVKVGKITALADDLALALSARSIRIEAPVPGKGYVGIEVPNEQSALVALRDVIETERYQKLKGSLRLALGQDVSGGPIVADLAAMPHLLIAGTTGSGKSVCVNGIIACLLLQNTPDDLKLLMVDPKRVELTGYNGIPHLSMPVVVDLERVVASLQWVTREMDERYRRFAKQGVRNIADYNTRAATSNEKKLPYLVVIIDELADLMMLAPDETERIITRLAQLARATGIHLIIATQRPSVDVVTGLIKANFPARIAFAVASGVDSRVILDQPGAERLLGRGDMLFQSPDAPGPIRSQGAFVSDTELQRITRYWKGARGFDPAAETAHLTSDPTMAAPPPATPKPVDTSHIVAVGAGLPPAPRPAAAPSTPPAPAGAPSSPRTEQPPLWDPAQFGPQFGDPLAKTEGEDELLEEAIKAVREMKKASISLLQRRLRIGYTRAARLIDVLEEKGVIGPAKAGAQQREVIGAETEVDPTRRPPASSAPPAEDEPPPGGPPSGGPHTRTWTND